MPLNQFIETHTPALKEGIRSLDDAVLLAMYSARDTSAILIRAEALRRLPAMDTSLVIDLFINNNESSTRDFLWTNRLRDAELSPDDIASIAMAAARSKDYKSGIIREEAYEKLISIPGEGIRPALMMLISQSRSLREKAYAEFIRRNAGKAEILHCLEFKELRMQAWGQLLKQPDLSAEDLEPIQDMPLLVVHIRQALKKLRQS